MGKYFGTDGFRGEANVTLNVEHAYKVGRYLGWYFGREHKARVVIGKDTWQHEGGIKLTADGQQQHLFSLGRRPPHARTAGATGQPVQPGGFHPSGLDAAEPSVEVNIGDNTDTNQVTDRASDTVHGSECIHEKRMPFRGIGSNETGFGAG